MNKGLKWALIIGGVGVTGVAGYFIYKKFIKKDDALDTDNGNTLSNTSNTKPPTPSTPTIKVPFRNKTEGDAFRKWVNDTYPKYAKDIDLSETGSYNNSYIQKAWKEYGVEYAMKLMASYVVGYNLRGYTTEVNALFNGLSDDQVKQLADLWKTKYSITLFKYLQDEYGDYYTDAESRLEKLGRS
jgi:hypothetical protein